MSPSSYGLTAAWPRISLSSIPSVAVSCAVSSSPWLLVSALLNAVWAGFRSDCFALSTSAATIATATRATTPPTMMNAVALLDEPDDDDGVPANGGIDGAIVTGALVVGRVVAVGAVTVGANDVGPYVVCCPAAAMLHAGGCVVGAIEVGANVVGWIVMGALVDGATVVGGELQASMLTRTPVLGEGGWVGLAVVGGDGIIPGNGGKVGNSKSSSSSAALQTPPTTGKHTASPKAHRPDESAAVQFPSDVKEQTRLSEALW